MHETIVLKIQLIRGDTIKGVYAMKAVVDKNMKTEIPA